jgi:hypothetical protein
MQGTGMRASSQLLVEGFHSPACIRLVEWRDRKSIVTLTTTTHQFLCPACQRGRSEMQGLPQAPGLVVLGGCLAQIVKSIVLYYPHQPINFSSLRAPCQRGRGEMQPQTQGPLVKLLVEGSIAPARHAFVWSSGAIVNLS